MKHAIPITKAHRLMSPRVVYIITTIDSDSVTNAASVSYLIPVSENPERLAFAISDDTKTYANLQVTGEFVVNVPGIQILSAVWICGGNYPRDLLSGTPISKLKIAGLSEVPSLLVKPACIRECYAHIECRLTWIQQVGDHCLVLGDIIAASHDEAAFDEKQLLNTGVQPAMQLTGAYFTSPYHPYYKADEE